MRRPHVYERTAPRVRSEMTAPAVRPGEVAHGISRALSSLIDGARAAGLDSLADTLDLARMEAQRAAGAASREDAD